MAKRKKGCGAILHIGGPTFRICVRGKIELFEMSSRFGPLPCTQVGSERRVGNRHPFWEAVSWWREQGYQVDADGLCVWSVPPPPKVRHLGGRHYELVHEPPAG
jgi:hypothetical protein